MPLTLRYNIMKFKVRDNEHDILARTKRKIKKKKEKEPRRPKKLQNHKKSKRNATAKPHQYTVQKAYPKLFNHLAVPTCKIKSMRCQSHLTFYSPHFPYCPRLQSSFGVTPIVSIKRPRSGHRVSGGPARRWAVYLIALVCGRSRSG